MKNYIKPEVNVENLFSAVTVASDRYDFSVNLNNNEVEVSSTDWWDLLG